MTDESRRGILRALGAAGTFGVAGCSALESGGSDGPKPAGDEGSASTDDRSDDGKDAASIGGWSTVGRDASRAGYAPDETGPTQSPTVEWRSDRRCGGYQFHSPSVADGTVFACSEDARLYALEADGTKRWHVELGAKPTDGPPPVADDTVLAGTTDEAVYGLSTADGTERWRYDTGEHLFYNPVVRDGRAALLDETGTVHVLATEDGTVQWSSSVVSETIRAPVVGDDAVFVAGEDRLVAHSLADGSRLWQTSFASGTNPRLVDGTLLVVDDDDALVGFDASTGRERWRQPIDVRFVEAASADRGTAVIRDGGSRGTFVAVDVADGTVEWTKDSSARADSVHVVGDIVYAVVVAGLAKTPDERVFCYAFDRKSGERLARRRIEDEITGLAADAGSIYAGGEDGFVRAFDHEDLTRDWRFGSNGAYHGHTAVVDGTVLAATEGQYSEYPAEVVAFSATDGSEQWSVEVENQFTHGMTVADGTVVTGMQESTLLAVDVADGPGQWRVQLPDTITGAPAVLDGTVYVAGEQGRVAAYGLADGGLEWERTLSGAPGGAVAAVPQSDGPGHVVVATDDGIWSLDTETGEERWRADGSSVSRSVVVNDRVYVSANEGLLAFDLADGEEQWRQSVEDGGIVGAPAVDDDRVYAGGYVGSASEGWVRAFSADDGDSEWRADVGASVIAPPTVAGGVVYVPDQWGTLHARDATDGTERWRRSFPTEFLEQVTVVDGRVVLAGIGVRSLIEE